ncbi:MAG: LptF/LptG family permease [Xanthobacteraceae bacterium]
MIAGTLSRYFAMRFVASVVGSFIGVIALAAMIDYVELMRRGADWPNATAWLLAKISMYRVLQLTERILPFTVLVGAMSCYLTLSRRHELVVARAAGVSAWQFVAPAVVAAFLVGTVATTRRCCTSARSVSRPTCKAPRFRRCNGQPVVFGCGKKVATAPPSSMRSAAANKAHSSAA